eukprot:scaffold23399_cov135-Isochrysis_galbana.AAC.3
MEKTADATGWRGVAAAGRDCDCVRGAAACSCSCSRGRGGCRVPGLDGVRAIADCGSVVLELQRHDARASVILLSRRTVCGALLPHHHSSSALNHNMNIEIDIVDIVVGRHACRVRRSTINCITFS